MPMSSYEFGDRPFDVEDLVLISNDILAVGVPFDTDAKFRSMIMAAMQTYLLRNKSIDNIYRKYGRKLEERLKPDKEIQLVRSMTSTVKKLTRQELKKIWDLDLSDHLGLFASQAALIRLQATIRSAIMLIHFGFHYESASIMRMILEQLAWVYKIHSMVDDQIFAIKPSKCINDLKKIFPKAGKIYGSFSESAHIELEKTRQYVHVTDESVTIKFTTTEHSPYDAYALLSLADIYISMIEIVFADYLKNFKHTVKHNQERLPKASRPIQAVRNRYWKLISKQVKKT